MTRPVFLTAILAAGTEVAAAWLVTHHSPPWIGLTPILPYMIFFAALVRSVVRMDEMQKRICIEAASIAFLITLIVAAVCGGLEQAGLGHPPWGDIGGLMMLLWTGAHALSAWRYRVGAQ